MMFTLGDANAIYKKATLYVPQGSEGDYAIAEGWKNFAGIEVFPLVTGVETIHLDAPIQKSKVYHNLRCQRLTAPQKGINIIGGRKVVVR